MARPFLTIAIPTYNRADLLGLCLSKIFEQLGPYAELIELLVSNNASTDHTKQVVKKYQQEYPQLRYWENEKNGGPDFNIAKCFELATAKYVWVFSDDDLMLPTALEHIIPFLRQYEPGVLFLKANFYKDSVNEFVADVEPFAYKIYTDAAELVTEQQCWITYISGIVVDKDLVRESDPLYFYQDSFVIQLGWILPVLLRAKQNAQIMTPLILGRALDVLDFKLFKVFGANFPRVLTDMAAKGTIPIEIKDILIELTITVYLHWNTRPEVEFHYGEKPLRILIQSFWNRKSFWTILMPRFIQRAYLTTLNQVTHPSREFFEKVVVRLFRKANSIYSNSRDRGAEKSLKSFGSHSELPEGHLILNPQYVVIGKQFKALPLFIVETRTKQGGVKFTPSVVIGDRVQFGSGCRIDCCTAIHIGNWVLIGHRVLITDNELDETPQTILNQPPANRKLVVKGPVEIGDYVLIEDGVRIFSGVTIGQNTIVKADAVVCESMPANAIVAGNPARVESYF